MLFFAIVIFGILAIFIHIGFWLHVLPILVGVLLLVGCNLLSGFRHNRPAPIWWSIVTGMVTVLCTALQWKAIWDPRLDWGILPLMLLLGYGGVSLLVFAIGAAKHKK